MLPQHTAISRRWGFRSIELVQVQWGLQKDVAGTESVRSPPPL